MRGDEKLAERERRVISLVGGGGKTTTMYALAEIFREEGKKVIVTTSTHLQTPPEEIRAWNIEEVRSLWKSDQIAVIGTDCESNKNLAAGDQAAVNQMDGVVSWASFPGDAGLEAEQKLIDMRDQILNGVEDIETIMKETQDAINQILEK